MNRIKVKVLQESGFDAALLGMSLSHGLHKKEIGQFELDRRKYHRAKKLATKGLGHNKFLESIIMWLDVSAPRYWWQQADTYRLSTKQSESTMHTILKRELTQEDFFEPIEYAILEILNDFIANKDFAKVKNNLPESFLQRRIWCLSYKTFQNMYQQRENHKLEIWRLFLYDVLEGLQFAEFIDGSGLPPVPFSSTPEIT